MSECFKTVLSLSLSGALLILVLLLIKPLVRDRLSKRWQYYIWLVVLARLLLPFAPEGSLMETVFSPEGERPLQREIGPKPGIIVSPIPPVETKPVDNPPIQYEVPPVPVETGTVTVNWGRFLLILWLGTALLLLMRKITAYQSFVRYLKAGCTEVMDLAQLNQLAQVEEKIGVNRPVELYINPLAASPMLLGFFRPCIVLPVADLPEEDFQYTVLHELIHYRHRDLCYKWLVQLTVCLHWFNPLVWRMGWEIDRACELACDEAVLRTLDDSERRAYGTVLLHTAETAGGYRTGVAAVTLHEGAELLKERLEAIMRFKKGSRRTAVLSLLLTGVLAVSGAAAGAYSGPAKEAARPALLLSELRERLDTVKDWRSTLQVPQKTGDSTLAAQAERYYDADSLPLFGMVFSRLSEAEQRTWMEWFYQNDETAFFSVAVNNLETDSPLLAEFAKKAYRDEDISFFSVLADEMPKEQLEAWLDQALQDERFNFQSSLFGKLDMDQERAALEAELDRQRLEEYAAHGITKNGKNYYYRGELINIFVDRQQNRTVYYTLEINPAGTVNLKVTRDGNGRIQQVETMTQAEAEALLRELEIGDLDDDLDDDWDDEDNWDDWDDWDWEKDDKKGAQLEQRLKEYAALGVTTDGKDYYYQGTLARIFLDQQPNGAFYVLEINQAGTVDLKTVRGEDGKLQRVERMTQAEAEALLSDMEDDSAAMDTIEIKGITYYLIYSEAQLRAIGTDVYSLDKNYIQQADIMLSDEEWVPIGTEAAPFTGSYNGNGFVIKGLTMTNPDARLVGMFGVAKGASLYNITLEDYDIADAGRNAPTKSVAPIVAVAVGSAYSFDNVSIPKER